MLRDVHTVGFSLTALGNEKEQEVVEVIPPLTPFGYCWEDYQGVRAAPMGTAIQNNPISGTCAIGVDKLEKNLRMSI